VADGCGNGKRCKESNFWLSFAPDFERLFWLFDPLEKSSIFEREHYLL
jgi:hypothetical protein